jgi:hypothetical protein
MPQKYCGWDCKIEGQKTLGTTKCELCSKEFQKTKGTKTKNRFCSHNCADTFNRGENHANFIMTDEIKEKLRNAQLGRKHTAEHTEKSRQKMIGLLVGSKNPNWKNGATPLQKLIRESREMKLWKLEVFERDRYTCQECGDKSGGNLQANHIKRFATHPELRFELTNGITLCKKCHEAIRHKEEQLENYFFLKLYNNRYRDINLLMS